jgi:hypothetical protein
LRNAEEAAFTRFSKIVQKAIGQVGQEARKPPIQGRVLFSAGDDLLFSGFFDPLALGQLRELYREVSQGRTCSVGFGTSPRAAYVALKMAKARPGKDTMLGVVLASGEEDP